MGKATLLLLGDGRFPAGAHAHSGGIEAAHAAGYVHDLASLDGYIRGRLATVGVIEAAFSARAAAGIDAWPDLDRALDARVLSPRIRSVSRALGRQLLRTGSQVWPDGRLETLLEAAPAGVHQPIAMGAVAAASGLDPHDAACCSLHHLVSGLATAALRLLGLDPFLSTALLAALGPTVESMAGEAVRVLGCPLDAMPATGGPLTEILAEDHATWEVRLFAS
jgi:urease accessory protein